MKKMRLIALILLCLSVGLETFALNVTDLRVQASKNPEGLDESPEFSWKLQSDERGVLQTAYKIVLATDVDGKQIVFDSGFIESEQSVAVTLNGASLLPSTRYFWQVFVRDNKGNEAESTEQAYFDTGLLSSGWGSAMWIKATDVKYGHAVPSAETMTDYTVEAKFEIGQVAAGLIFSKQDATHYYMWQFNIERSNPRFRPHRWNGSAAALGDIDLANVVNLKAGKEYSVKIVVTDARHAVTYLNGVKIDERDGEFKYGAVGVRQSYAEGGDRRPETAYFDDFKVTGSNGEVLFSEAFDSANHSFEGGKVVDGRLYVEGVSMGDDVNAWPKQQTSASSAHYAIDFDMYLVKASAAIIFGKTPSNSYYMWQINCHDNALPAVRHHVYVNGTLASHDDAQFSQFAKADLLGHKHHYRVEVDGNLIKTFVDDKLVDTYTDSRGGAALGDIGLRIDPTNTGEEAYFDNVVETVYAADGSAKVVVSDDFEHESDFFIGAKTEMKEGSQMCHMQSSGGEKKLMQLSSDGVPMFRKAFTLGQKVRSAKLYTSAMGVYDFMINGKRVGHVGPDGTLYEEMKPGFTDSRNRLFYSSHDVTSLLQEGSNAMGAVVTSGWYSGGIAHGIAGSADDLGLIAKLLVTFEDGTTQTVVTDGTWASSRHGALLYSDIYNGEIYDARRVQDFTSPAYDASDWNAVAKNIAFRGKLESFKGPFVKLLSNKIQTAKTTTIYEGTKATGTDFGMVNVVSTQQGTGVIVLRKGQTACIDFGQNIVGWPSFTVKGAAGTRLHFVLTEMLNDTGAKSRGNDGAGGTPYLANMRSARAEVYYSLAGNQAGESWHPSTTFYGFRYCTVTATSDVEIQTIEAWPISSSNDDTGTLSTSNEMVNQLISNIEWGQRGNLLSIPTDCPQRDERQGWTADTQVYAHTGMYNADTETFYNKWMLDMRDGQREDGAFPDIAPQTGYAPYGGAAWSDAGIIVPWITYQMYGNKKVIAQNFEAMEKYMRWVAAQTGDGKYQGASTTYGDWVAYVETDKRYISMLYYAHDADLMAQMSRALSTANNDIYMQKAMQYDELFANIKAAIQARYFTSAGMPRLTTQCALVLALNFKVYKDEAQKQQLVKLLDRTLTATGDVLNTGFLGTSVLNHTLSEVGLNHHAYNLLLQRKNPSWLYPIDQGATTMWERWNSYTKEKGFQDPGMNSFNHYAYGAVGEWMYRFMSGIESDVRKPGFKHIILQPTPDQRTTIPATEERITQVDGRYNSRYGIVSSAWKSADGKTIDYTCEVPANTTATLYLPVDEQYAAAFKAGKASVDMTGIEYVDYKDGKMILNLGSGRYSFPSSVTNGIATVAKEQGLSVYPNPAHDTVFLRSAQPITAVKLFALNGNLVKSIARNVESLPLGGLPESTYLLKVTTTLDDYTVKLVHN